MTLRGVNGVAMLGATAFGAAILACCVAFTGTAPPLTYARLGLVALITAAAFVLDEPAAAAVDATPTTLRRRTAVRLTAVSGPFTVWTLSVIALHRRSVQTPVGHLLVEGAGVLALTVAVAAVLRAVGRLEPGEVVATAMGGSVLGLVLFDPPPRSISLFPVGQGWPASTALWCSLTIVAAALITRAARDAYRW